MSFEQKPLMHSALGSQQSEASTQALPSGEQPSDSPQTYFISVSSYTQNPSQHSKPA